MFPELSSYSMAFLLVCGLMVLVVIIGIAISADFTCISVVIIAIGFIAFSGIFYMKRSYNAMESENGSITYTCTVCEDSYTVDTVPVNRTTKNAAKN